MAYVCTACTIHVTGTLTELAVNSDQFQISELHAVTYTIRSFALLLHLLNRTCVYLQTSLEVVINSGNQAALVDVLNVLHLKR